MAKVQGKKAASSKKASAKPAARPKSAKAPKSSVRKPPAPAKPKAAATKKPAVKKPAKPAPRAATKRPAHPEPKVVAKPKPPVAKPAVAKPAVAKPAVAKPAPVAAPKPAPSKTARAVKTVAKVAAVAVAAPVVVKAAKAVAQAIDEKKRVRRPRPRVQSSGTAVAAWFTQGEKPRPASFIPAPARAEAPSLIAAPPASSDRLLRADDVTELAVRTVPVRVDVEQGGGRVYIAVNPTEATLKPGEGIEWDFRYLGGADVTVEEIVIEFEKPSPFPSTTYKSRKPGTARPHRQLSGGAHANVAGKRIEYTIRAMNPFKTEMASTRVWLNVVA